MLKVFLLYHDEDQRFSGDMVDLLCITSLPALFGFEKRQKQSVSKCVDHSG